MRQVLFCLGVDLWICVESELLDRTGLCGPLRFEVSDQPPNNRLQTARQYVGIPRIRIRDIRIC